MDVTVKRVIESFDPKIVYQADLHVVTVWKQVEAVTFHSKCETVIEHRNNSVIEEAVLQFMTDKWLNSDMISLWIMFAWWIVKIELLSSIGAWCN